MNKLKEKFGFEFWQKFGKSLMVVIAVMPAAGLMISIGKTIAMINPNVAPLVITGGFPASAWRWCRRTGRLRACGSP